MIQLWRNPQGHLVEVGDRDDVAALLGKSKRWAMTFHKYSIKGVPKTNPPPKPVTIDMDTHRYLWVLAECRAWEFRREGPGRRVQAVS